MSDTPTPADFAAALAQVSDAMTAVVEAATGHRAKLETAGFSPTAAEHGAVSYHDALLRIIVDQARANGVRS